MSSDNAENVKAVINGVHQQAYDGYKELLEAGTARELARIVLPLSLYTEWYWQIDLHNLFRFLSLRLDPHAQKEIRAYAEVMRDIAGRVCPMAFESFERHFLGGVRFSGSEMAALNRMIQGESHGLKGRDAERFEVKLAEKRQM